VVAASILPLVFALIGTLVINIKVVKPHFENKLEGLNLIVKVGDEITT